MKTEVVVIFRAERWGKFKGDVTAVFPEIPGTAPYNMMCYEHVGQHGICDKGWYRAKTRPAKLSEYRALLAELIDIGYQPIIRHRITRANDERRMAEARRDVA